MNIERPTSNVESEEGESEGKELKSKGETSTLITKARKEENTKVREMNSGLKGEKEARSEVRGGGWKRRSQETGDRSQNAEAGG